MRTLRLAFLAVAACVALSTGHAAAARGDQPARRREAETRSTSSGTSWACSVEGRLQRRLLPRLVPGQGRLPPVAVRLRPGEGLRRPHPRQPRPPRQPRRPRRQPAAAQGHRPGRRTTAAMRFGKDSLAVPRLPRVDRATGRRGRPAAATSPSSTVSPPELRLRRGRRDRPGEGDRPRSPTARPRTSPRSATSASTTTPSPTSSPLGAGHGRCSRATPAVVVFYRGNVQAGPRPGAGAAPAGLQLPEGARGQLHRPRGVRQAASC